MLGTPTSIRVTDRKEATRAEILEAAWELAREKGLGQITLRDLAGRVGMRAPSLYTHFDSKNAIHDAMFAQAWADLLTEMRAATRRLPKAPRARLKRMMRVYFDFAVSDLPRNQLMSQRTLPGFAPSDAAYAPAVAALETCRELLSQLGVTRPADVDLYIALVGGLVDAQLANDPGGSRWRRLVDRAAEMYADAVGIPAHNLETRDDS
jgi:AcrR family transcriptional regulator